MANQRNGKLDISLDDVVRWDEYQEMGIVKEIRVIDTAKFVQKFSGNEDTVMLRIHTNLGTALIWPKECEIVKVSDHDAKEFKLKFKQNNEIEQITSWMSSSITKEE